MLGAHPGVAVDFIISNIDTLLVVDRDSRPAADILLLVLVLDVVVLVLLWLLLLLVVVAAAVEKEEEDESWEASKDIDS